MNEYYREKLHVNHFWELKGQRLDLLLWACIYNYLITGMGSHIFGILAERKLW